MKWASREIAHDPARVRAAERDHEREKGRALAVDEGLERQNGGWLGEAVGQTGNTQGI